ncbi:hypothetical protein ABTJ36_08940 [Acinetobacter baumannii]
MRISLVLVLLLLSGCIGNPFLEKKLEAKKGMTKSELIKDFGIPDREYKGDDFEILEYKRSSISSRSTSEYVPVYQNKGLYSQQYLLEIPQTSIQEWHCKIEFRLIDGVVRNYRYSGNNC